MRTIEKIMLMVGAGKQTFEIPGFEGVAFISANDTFANQIEVYCHTDPAKPKYSARFKVTTTGEASPSDSYVYIASVKRGAAVWHVWRHGLSERVEEDE